MTPLCDRDVADEDAIMSMEEGGMKVGESAVPGPSESRDEPEIDCRRRLAILTKRKQKTIEESKIFGREQESMHTRIYSVPGIYHTAADTRTAT